MSKKRLKCQKVEKNGQKKRFYIPIILCKKHRIYVSLITAALLPIQKKNKNNLRHVILDAKLPKTAVAKESGDVSHVIKRQK